MTGPISGPLQRSVMGLQQRPTSREEKSPRAATQRNSDKEFPKVGENFFALRQLEDRGSVSHSWKTEAQRSSGNKAYLLQLGFQPAGLQCW